jgi:ribA/ribD-fused uncharacterized protein
MRLLISGGRDFMDIEFITTRLDKLHSSRDIECLIHGDAKGADTIGGTWADNAGILVIPVKANWYDANGVRDKGAGHKRNQRMLDEFKPDALFAFPGGTGTADMVTRAEKVLSEVWVSHRNFFKKEDPESWFLSNLAEHLEFFDNNGLRWATSEHYYQAMKSPIPEEREHVRLSISPAQAKKRGGKEINRTADWPTRKFDVMRQALDYKFAPGTRAAGLLKETGIEYLVEWAPWGDVVWGVDKNGYGENWLGRMLMHKRDSL